jgi:outer membrane murein-binding lipoprotein Lpp
MTGSWLEWAIIIFIVASIGTVVWRGGAANPEGTGTLGKKVSRLSGNVSTLSQRVGHLENEVADLMRDAATAKDLQRIEMLIEERTGAQRDLMERSARSIDRIERLLIEKGLGK